MKTAKKCDGGASNRLSNRLSDQLSGRRCITALIQAAEPADTPGESEATPWTL
jgi:hypothetical protein